MSLGTLTDLARLDGMPSYPSLARFIAARDDFPVIQRGQYGKPFILDLDAAAAFVRANWRDGRNERRLRRLAAAAKTRDPIQGSLPGILADDQAASSR
ncbi:hypothetical protein MOP88_09605 [Sphingomonas sp. WKB10]|nr:hypothetical protein [Sphingomonas sp. WKB10]MCI1142495.1 hypothetical protein [Sphingomonas sp. WKB10]